MAAKTQPERRDPFERDRARLTRYREYRDFYDGVQWLGRPRRGEKRLTVNYARALVRKVVSYALPGQVTFTVPLVEESRGRGVEKSRSRVSHLDSSTGSEATLDFSTPHQATLGSSTHSERAQRDAGERQANEVERILAELLDELDADRVDFALAIDSAVLGDGAMKVTWDPRAQRPRLATVDPATLLAWWSPDTPTEAYRIQQHYQLPAETLGALGWASPAMGAGDQLLPVIEDWTGDRWVVTVSGQTVRDEANPYGWLPYLVLPNNQSGSQFWGESDLPDLVDVCRELNSRLSVLAEVLDLSGAPITVLENIDGSEGIRVGPGAKWEIPEGAKAYLLDLLAGGGVRLHIDYVSELRTSLHDLAETPRTAFGEAGRAVSGAALETELQPLVQKVNRKRRGLAGVYRRRNAMLLDLLERFGGAPIGGLRRTVPVWPPILPSDREAEARVGVQLVNARVRSRRSVAADLGEQDPDRELTRIVEEAERLAGIAAGEGADTDGSTEATEDGETPAAESREAGERRPGGEATRRAEDEGAAVQDEAEPRAR